MTTEKKINCREFIEFLDDYIDEQLSSNRRLVFDDHLSRCKECVSYLDSYKKSIQVLKSVGDDKRVPEDAPAELINAIIAARLNTARNQSK